jgi:dolichol-phosphate mannosyltransferase
MSVDAPPSVSFVIPCYQEEAALAALAPFLAEIPAEEIMFVDDGSRDGTAAALANLAAADPRIRLVTHPLNRGVGAAMRSGVAATTGAVVVIYDADRTYPLADARRLVEALEAGGGRDVVTATPFGADGGLEDVPFFRRLLSQGAALSYRLVLGRRARGINVYTCAFRAWRGDLIRGLTWKSDGFPAAAEMFGRAILGGARVAQAPSTLRSRTEGVSKMRVLPTMWGHLGVLTRLLWARWR